jgi:hypothetical protein
MRRGSAPVFSILTPVATVDFLLTARSRCTGSQFDCHIAKRCHGLEGREGAGIRPSVRIANMDRVPTIVFHGDREYDG